MISSGRSHDGRWLRQSRGTAPPHLRRRGGPSRQEQTRQQARKASSIRTVHRRPPIGPVSDVGGEATLAGDLDEGGHEPLVAVAVDRWRVAHNGRTHADAAKREGEESSGGPQAAGLARTWGLATKPSFSVATRPIDRPTIPPASTKGRSEPARAAPIASTARRSAAAAAGKLPPNASSCWNARWITPSDLGPPWPERRDRRRHPGGESRRPLAPFLPMRPSGPARPPRGPRRPAP